MIIEKGTEEQKIVSEEVYRNDQSRSDRRKKEDLPPEWIVNMTQKIPE